MAYANSLAYDRHPDVLVHVICRYHALIELPPRHLIHALSRGNVRVIQSNRGTIRIALRLDPVPRQISTTNKMLFEVDLAEGVAMLAIESDEHIYALQLTEGRAWREGELAEEHLLRLGGVLPRVALSQWQWSQEAQRWGTWRNRGLGGEKQ